MTEGRARESVVEIRGLHVRYGREVALQDVSFTVERGAVYALLGRNGAGKTSLLRCLLGLQKPDAGHTRILEKPSWAARSSMMARVGTMAETPNAPPRMSSRRTFRFLARIHPGADERLFEERLERFGVDPDRPFGQLSRGQKTVVSLGFALVSSPEVLILDDPTLGLDPQARRSFFDELISDLADRNTTVLLSSHDLAGIEGIADRIGVLSQARLILDEDLDSIKARYRRLRFSADSELPAGESRNGKAERMRGLGLLTQQREAWGMEAVTDAFGPGKAEELRAVLGSDLEIEPLSLEEIFLSISDSDRATGKASR
jgi:ABC-2 type transport system ATP-binding protein